MSGLPPLFRTIPPSRRQLCTALLLLLSLLLLAAGATAPIQANQPENQAALVIDFGDGRVIARLVSFPEASISGSELLQRSGLNVALLTNLGGGTLLCAVEEVGCPPTPQECFCQCQGSDCRYWSYFHLQQGAWVYGSTGAGEYRLSDGDVDGWRWGDGTSPPPLLTWEEIVQLAQPAAPTATPVPPTAPPASATPLPPTSTPPPPTTAATPSPAATEGRTTQPSAVPPTDVSTPSSTPTTPPTSTLPTATAQPTATPATTTPAEDENTGGSTTNLLAFAGMAIVLLALWAWVRWQRRG